MAALLFAIEVEIPRPETTTGWLFLVFAVVFGVFLINEGLYILVKETWPELKKTLCFFAVLLVVGVLAANEADWDDDPVGSVELLPADDDDSTDPLAGVETSNEETGSP
ncbi:MAG: hypothetical protein OES24_02070 [Acidimicrobiia bacterium]|nr:hypothetical protein [Acidimicrobiia bacterium]